MYSLALLWLYNGMMPPLAARQSSLNLLTQLGIAHGWDWLLFVSASLWDIALGIALLIPALRYQRWLWALQILTTSLYSLIIAIGLLWMMYTTHMTFSIKWLAWALGLYLFAGLCWLPVVWLQLQLAKDAAQAAANGATELPKAYWQKARLWECLGYPAFIAMVVVYFLMVLKPS